MRCPSQSSLPGPQSQKTTVVDKCCFQSSKAVGLCDAGGRARKLYSTERLGAYFVIDHEGAFRMDRVKDTLTKIDGSFRAIVVDLDGLEKDLRHFHRKDERRRFDELKDLVGQLRRQVRQLEADCAPCR